ncbi:MAG: CTP synthase C-terminal region-related (seleno)protein [Dehalococcoidia bacterium]
MLRIGIVGDFHGQFPSHVATNDAFVHAAAALDVGVDVRWLPTESLLGAEGEAELERCNALLVAPGSPYRCMDGALRAIRYAREGDVPLIGTCGGFQHVVIEYARSVLGFVDAEHAETSPEASRLFITPLTCSIAGQRLPVTVVPGSRAHALYGCTDVEESYYCNFGLNPVYRAGLQAAGLRVTGTDDTGEARLLELPSHRFFLATLFVPQMRSTAVKPHPLIVGLLRSAGDGDRQDEGVQRSTFTVKGQPLMANS